MSTKQKSTLSRLSSDKRGSAAIIFGLMCIPAMLILGAAVDYGRLSSARSSSQGAIDAAALAGTKAAQMNPTTATASATSAASTFFGSQKLAGVVSATLSTPTVNSSTNTYTWTASVWVQTPFMTVGGLLSHKAAASNAPAGCTSSWWACQNFVVTASATTKTGAGNNIETAMIFDLSGSMGDSDGSGSTKIASLRTAATALANTLIWSDQSTFTSKIAIAPYQIGVNVGTYATQVRGPIASGTSTTPGSTNYTFTPANTSTQVNTENSGGVPQATSSTYTYNSKNSITQAISNCVSERTGTHAYDDVAPSTAFVGLNYPDPNNPCQSPVITPLTNNLSTVTTNISQLASGGSTAPQVGIAWGWYLLSPNWGNLWPTGSQPEPYSDLTTLNQYGNKTVRKIAILMTDGGWNSSYCNGVISADSTYGSGNEATHINCNATNGSVYQQATNLCTAMKAQGIELFTIAFLVGTTDATTESALQACATDSSHYFLASNGTALQTTFQQIAAQMQALQLTE